MKNRSCKCYSQKCFRKKIPDRAWQCMHHVCNYDEMPYILIVMKNSTSHWGEHRKKRCLRLFCFVYPVRFALFHSGRFQKILKNFHIPFFNCVPMCLIKSLKRERSAWDNNLIINNHHHQLLILVDFKSKGKDYSIPHQLFL